ncbi:hypothetical protein FRB93_006234 [Tulasnella sp. JGI-2019a]|nr:hypothetical protein FRB93_006234 [Tulasnella sp. JGI-2019a]
MIQPSVPREYHLIRSQYVVSKKSPHNGDNSPNERKQMLKKFKFLRLVYKIFGQRIQRHIAETSRRFNFQAPIHRLPDELLVKIFALTIVTDSLGGPRLPQIVRLGLASKNWHTIVYETPSLWAQISSRYSDRENKVAILRSKEHPLRVHYDLHDYMTLGDTNEAKFVTSASREAHRWQSAEFDLRSARKLVRLRSTLPFSVP